MRIRCITQSEVDKGTSEGLTDHLQHFLIGYIETLLNLDDVDTKNNLGLTRPPEPLRSIEISIPIVLIQCSQHGLADPYEPLWSFYQAFSCL